MTTQVQAPALKATGSTKVLRNAPFPSGRPDVLDEIARGCSRVQVTDVASRLRPGPSQQTGSVTKFLYVSEAAPGAVEAIISPSRHDVHVIVPDVLVAVGLVVLTRGDTVAAECRLHGDGRRANGSLNWCPEFDREVVDVFVVIVRDDEHRARVPRPPLRVHLHEDVVVAMKELEWEVRRPCCQISTEGTVVAGRLVVVHDVIFVDGPRAYAPKGNPLVVQERPYHSDFAVFGLGRTRSVPEGLGKRLCVRLSGGRGRPTRDWVFGRCRRRTQQHRRTPTAPRRRPGWLRTGGAGLLRSRQSGTVDPTRDLQASR